jgi:hypothetical protein
VEQYAPVPLCRCACPFLGNAGPGNEQRAPLTFPATSARINMISHLSERIRRGASIAVRSKMACFHKLSRRMLLGKACNSHHWEIHE